MASKENKWTLKKERRKIEERLNERGELLKRLERQKQELRDKITEASANKDYDEVDRLQVQLNGVIEDIKDTTHSYNNDVDTLNKFEEIEEKAATKWCNWINVVGGVGIGIVSLAFTHRDAIGGYLKEKGADQILQTIWRGMWGKRI